MKDDAVFRILFTQGEKSCEVYARYISEETLMGFIEVEELVFSENSSLVPDSAEEKLKAELSNVKRCYIPMHAILRIDEVMSVAKAREDGPVKRAGNVSHFPNVAASTQNSSND